MKRGWLMILVLSGILLAFPLVSAQCNFDARLLSQDPYPANPGDYVKVVFQLDGVSDPSCGTISFSLQEEYPFSLDPGVDNTYQAESGIYGDDLRSFWLIPYQIRVDEEAFDGENSIEVEYFATKKSAPSVTFNEEFNITVENPLTDFEVHVSDYSFSNKRLILEILNIGERNIEALTIQIPDQENVEVIGTNRYIVGDLDSNDEEIATFDAEMREGNVDVLVSYTDQIGVRRTLTKTILFNPALFERAESDEGNTFSPTNSFFLGILIPVVIFFIYRYVKKRKERHKRHLHHHTHSGGKK